MTVAGVVALVAPVALQALQVAALGTTTGCGDQDYNSGLYPICWKRYSRNTAAVRSRASAKSEVFGLGRYTCLELPLQQIADVSVDYWSGCRLKKMPKAEVDSVAAAAPAAAAVIQLTLALLAKDSAGSLVEVPTPPMVLIVNLCPSSRLVDRLRPASELQAAEGSHAVAPWSDRTAWLRLTNCQ